MVDIIIGGKEGNSITEMSNEYGHSSIRMHTEKFQSWVRPFWTILQSCGLVNNKEEVLLTDQVLETLQEIAHDSLGLWLSTWSQKAKVKYGELACISIGW